MIPVTPTLSLDDSEIELSFIRSSGPGGQNVNKVATAVQLRFDARRSPSLPNDVAIRLMALAGKRATTDGVIVITANRHRTQEMNRKDAIDRLVEMIVKATHAPKRRVATKVSKGQKKQRLEGKKKRSGVKAGRRVGAGDWD
ncbi:MAG: aminoacyl-tRNA hydrolase [Proteobacteria bacterium]|nr:aminoacyl-tRNA hydrolase [Pseudomonadota bacterium]